MFEKKILRNIFLEMIKNFFILDPIFKIMKRSNKIMLIKYYKNKFELINI